MPCCILHCTPPTKTSIMEDHRKQCFICNVEGQKRKLHNIVWLDCPLTCCLNHLATTWSKLQKQSITECGPLPPPAVHLNTAERAPECLFLLHQTGRPGDWIGVLSSLKLLPRYATNFSTSSHLQQYNTRVLLFFRNLYGYLWPECFGLNPFVTLLFFLCLVLLFYLILFLCILYV